MRWIILILALTIHSVVLAQDSLIIASYNVENLFDCQHDTLKNDSSFLPDGMHHWSYSHYSSKLDRIAQVLVNMAAWQTVPIVGLCEVENARCLRDLCYRLRRFHYAYVHYESADERGIDVALLYDTTQINLLSSKPLPICLDGDFTRDVLYACLLLNERDTIHTMVCHLPSRLGGAAASGWKRDAVKAVIQQTVDSIYLLNKDAYIVVMGDMNDNPKNDIAGMYNMMLIDKQYATHKYQGKWSCLDQFYISYSLLEKTKADVYTPDWLLEEDTKYLGKRPYRTYIGYRYHGGYSDHLPILLRLKI